MIDFTALIESYIGPMDYRAKGLFLMGTPVPMVVMITLYLLMCIFKRKVAPAQAWTIPKWVTFLYNMFLVALSTYMAVGLWIETRKLGFSWVCNKWYGDDRTRTLLHYIHVFYVSKYIEYIDTILMVLRRKFDQVSLLHVWHHAAVVVVEYLCVGWVAEGDSYFAAMFNSFVHIWMYLYYGLAAIGIQPWWKKYMTQLQIFQFVCGISQAIAILYMDCTHIKWPYWIGGAFLVSLLFLFLHFYFTTYTKRPARPAAQPAPAKDVKKDN